MKRNPEFNVEKESSLLPFLLMCFSNKSRNYVKGLLARGQVVIDGVVCKDYSYTLHPGQQVKVLLKALQSDNKISIPVIYENKDIIVINKPVGMLSVSTDKERENTAYHLVNEYVKSRTKAERAFIVHRLDRETSGVMLFAKNEQIKNKLQENWDDIVIRRGYYAVVEGKVLTLQGQITSWLKQTKTLLVYSSKEEGDGKRAITNYHTSQITDKYSLLDIDIKTGRKNQIRVHMKDMGHPIAGDKKYGASTDPFGRLGLHAYELIIRYPNSGEKMRFEAAIPDIFLNAVR